VNCEDARLRIVEEADAPELRAHLQHCAACRAEARFALQVRLAVAAMPRLRAPATLADTVMASVRRRASVPRPTSSRPPLHLGTWEIGWLAALFLASVGLLSMALRGRGVPWGARLSAAAPHDLLSELWNLGAAVAASLRSAAEWLSVRPSLDALAASHGWGSLLLWLSGACSFALGYYLLLSWRGAAASGQRGEDAHA
jgi:hypothetical protein